MILFSKCKIFPFSSPRCIQQEVLRLQVPVDDPPGVQVVEGLHDAGGVEPGGAVVKVAPVAQDGPQLPAQAGLHQHVEVLAVLERLVQLDDELAVGLLHDLLLRHDVLLLAGLHDLKKRKRCQKRKKQDSQECIEQYSQE